MATAIPKIDSSKLYMLSKNYAEHVVPGVLCYLRFGDDKGGEYEIYVPPGREEEILRLNEQDDWEALLKFPPFSDQPPLTMRVNVAGYPLADGTYKMFHIPDDDAKHARMSELMEAQDYQSMEKEFEPWANQPNNSKQKFEEWMQGVARCALVRAKAQEQGSNEHE